MRGVLNLLLSIAAGAAIGVLIPQLPFLNDPFDEEYQRIEENLDAERAHGEHQRDDQQAEHSQSEHSPASSHVSVPASYSEESMSVQSEPTQRGTESHPLRLSSSERRQLSPFSIQSRQLSPLFFQSREDPPSAYPLPVPHEVSIIRDADVLAKLDIAAPISASKDSDDGKCTFCIEPVVPGQKARTTPCNHLFHASCLEQWVLYVTANLMNVAAYWLNHDGSIEFKSRFPFCPNCAKFLDVVPRHEWRVVLLTALAVALSVDSTNQAVALYERDVVVVDRSSPPVTIHIGAEEYGFRPRWMDENENYHYTFVARNEGCRVLLRVLAYPIVSASDPAIDQES